MTALLDQVEGLCRDARTLVDDGPLAASIDEAAARLREPLRVAIAGRMKTGKSTLLNALVGERLAPTDAGECTRIVTWYREGLKSNVVGRLPGGATVDLPFDRDGGRLNIGLDDDLALDLSSIEVSWPSSRLRNMTLVDTPGLGGRDPGLSELTREIAGLDGDVLSEVDAVVYLIRHLHPLDVEFLEAFENPAFAPTPMNSITVISRADEVGAGTVDPLQRAGAIADRFMADDRIRAMTATVIPVAGLLAETAATLTETETGAIRNLAALAESTCAEQLISVDRFRSATDGDVPSSQREELLSRLGLFGLELSIEAFREGRASTATDLARVLYAASGVTELVAYLDDNVAARADALKAASTLVRLRKVVDAVHAGDSQAAAGLEGNIERVEAGATEFAALRLAGLAGSDEVELTDDERSEIRRLTGSGSAESRLGEAGRAGSADLVSAALAGVERWRRRADHPMTSATVREACDIAVRLYELLHAEVLTRDTD